MENSKIFSVRIVSIDYYMAPPIPNFDICYSSFQGGKVNEVPVIRAYGSTPAGQKTCLHVHRAFPYLYVPCSDIPLHPDQEGDSYTNAISLALEKALKIDYNLYGMGHVHLSKMKFRHPVPDVCTLRKFIRNWQHGLEMENFTCMSTDFQAGLSGDESLDSPVWISSTIPGDWMWQFSSEFEVSSEQGIYHIKRQSICELEGDTTIDEILNQQFKTYTSLSQTCSDMKMVQSLIPIWEEEYERSGLHEIAKPPDPGKPLAEDVLKTLLHDLEFERKLKEFYGKSEGLPSFGNIVKFQQSSMSTDEENLAEHEKISSDNTNEQSLKCSTERDTIGSSSLLGSPFEDQLDTTPVERKDACPELLSVSDLQSSETIGTLDAKTADAEALSLLKWLVTSQAAEDINSDDELIHETILSPLLPATTIDQVLEKANMDYESESQKECQDILDSIEDLDDMEGFKERTFHSIGCRNHNQTLSEIPDADGLVSSSSRSSGNLSKIGMKEDSKSYFQDQVLQTTGTHFTSKRKRKKSLWGSLPFSMTQKRNDDLEAVGSNTADACIGQDKNCDTMSIIRNEGEKHSDVLLKTLDADVCEVGDLVGCSVRDLMRRKRCHRIAQQDCDNFGVKKVHSGGEYEQENVILPNKLGILALHDDEHDKKPLGFASFGPSVTDKQTVLSEVHDFKSFHPSCHSYIAVPFVSRDSALQVSTHRSPVDTRKKELQCLYMSDKQNSATAMGHCETNNDKELDKEGVIFTEALTSNLYNSKPDLSSGSLLSKDVNLVDKRLEQNEAAGLYSLTASLIEHETFSRDDCEYKRCHKGSKTMGQLYEIPSANPVGMYASADTTVPLNKNCCSTKHGGGSGFSVHDSSIFDGRPGSLIGMTLNKKPPIVDWEDGTSENTSALSYHASLLNEDNKHGNSGNALEEFLPFFEGDFQEEKVVQNEPLPDVDSNVRQESVLGVPTHYQNDGSLLYLLTPVYLPPSVDCVCRWLACDHEGTSGEINAWSTKSLAIKGSKGSSPVYGNNVPIELDSVSHLMPVQDRVQQEMHQNVNSEFHPNHDEIQRPLHNEGNNAKQNAGMGCALDLSQISGPNGRSKPTPLSQIGFRDPASIGAGQQLTLLSIEVQAETRGDLRPDPRFDAVNVVALAFQNDNDSAVEVFVLLHSNGESYKRSSDGISVNKAVYFSEEKHLFGHFTRIVGLFDPDILMGWDIQGGSLGFLAERAAHLGIGLLNNISRTPLEANIGNRETESADNGVLDTVLHESLLADSGLVDQAVIEDEWGRTHASGVHVGGRVVLNIWRLMRGEVKLNMYTVEAVGEAVLRRKIPLIPYRALTKWFSSGPGRARYRCIEYVIQRAKLNLEIMNQLDMVNRTSELARVFGIDFFSVLSRGSQYRVESMFLRLAHTQNYLAISPGNQQVASQPAMECLPLVMEPESGFYGDPVIVLDFQSLYPSMIIAYNLCFCTCLGNVTRSKEITLGVSSFSPDPHVLRDLKDKILLTPNGVMYVPPKVRKGILPRLLEEILSTRIMVKQAMKKLAPTQQVLHRIFNARQLALKLIANVTYGYTAAGFSGRMPCAELADSIVQCGRSTLEKAISLVNANDKWNAKVIYGDTDSMFVLLKGRTVKESFQIGHEIASAVTAMNPDPVTLKMEKVYHPCFLLSKKRYVGYSYESVDQIEPVFDAKGIETVRRDTCGAVAKMMEQSLRLFFEHQDISEIKGYLQRQWTRILSGRVSLQDFVFAKEVRLGTYSTRASSSLPPAAIVATKAMRADPCAEPRYAERVPYVVIHGEPGARLVDMVVDPLDLLAIDSPYRLNDIYYINKQIIPALQRVFGLLGADLNQWFSEMPRPGRDAFAKRPPYATNPQRTRIDFYYLSKHCVLCGELVHTLTHICNKCSQKETAAAMAVIGRTSKLEREMQHLAAICRHCGGGDWLLDSGVKCTSLACSVFYERRKVQKELQGLSAVASDKGFYTKCMVEWF
ncbi:hypothetical protein P3X46_035102 [Hevea brasiliensis]|uniref:DNA polymerase n=1 Tax=Hevea brasiliensis TaxID=3981 RepID=A0ABQ9KBW0_HEVBR|nr:hypothetical protein P3X46_035102 [Hevea brasiliensis]